MFKSNAFTHGAAFDIRCAPVLIRYCQNCILKRIAQKQIYSAAQMHRSLLTGGLYPDAHLLAAVLRGAALRWPRSVGEGCQQAIGEGFTGRRISCIRHVASNLVANGHLHALLQSVMHCCSLSIKGVSPQLQMPRLPS